MKIMSKRLARKEAHTIASAAIHDAILRGAANRYNPDSALKVHDELIQLMDKHGELSADMDEVESYLADPFPTPHSR